MTIDEKLQIIPFGETDVDVYLSIVTKENYVTIGKNSEELQEYITLKSGKFKSNIEHLEFKKE